AGDVLTGQLCMARNETGQRTYINDEGDKEQPEDPCAYVRAAYLSAEPGSPRWIAAKKAMKWCERKKPGSKYRKHK
ncbi:MAG: hypothetical protein ABIU54_06145, partial [Candidatus Eisenbacteria bacterium]